MGEAMWEVMSSEKMMEMRLRKGVGVAMEVWMMDSATVHGVGGWYTVARWCRLRSRLRFRSTRRWQGKAFEGPAVAGLGPV